MRRYKKKDYAKRNQIIIAIIMGSLMVGSLFGIIFSSYGNNSGSYDDSVNSYTNPTTGLTYEFEVDPNNNYAVLALEGEDQVFYSFPDQLWYLDFPVEARTLLNAPIIAFTFNPNENEDLAFISVARQDIDEYFRIQGVITTAGVTEKSIHPNLANFPLISCEQATLEQPVVYFMHANETDISISNNCIIITGSGQDFLSWRDRILYGLYGVMD